MAKALANVAEKHARRMFAAEGVLFGLSAMIASKRLADRTRRKYCYAWRGGPMLKAEDGTPLQPNDPQFVVAYTAAHAKRKKPPTGSLFSLIAAFRALTEFTGRAEQTQKDYRRYLKMIEEEFGTMLLAVVQDHLRTVCCTEVQGFLFSRPRAARDLNEFLTGAKLSGAAQGTMASHAPVDEDWAIASGV